MIKKINYSKYDYPIIIKKLIDDGEILYSAEIEELPGLIVYCDSEIEALKDLLSAKKDWIAANIELKRL